MAVLCKGRGHGQVETDSATEQPEIIVRKNKNGERGSLEMRYRDFEEQLGEILKRAVGRQVRRSEIGGMDWPPPIAQGYAPAPSAG